VLAALAMGTPAEAADPPTSITVTGSGLSEEIDIPQLQQQELFDRLLHQVSWMAWHGGDPMKPDPTKLGPKYVLTVFTGDKPLQVYEIYPSAEGGPRAYRPAKQPQGRTAEAWFYVSVSVPELLNAAGVPATGSTATGQNGALVYNDPAGYIPANVDTESRPLFSLSDIVHAQRRTVALWVGSALGVLVLVVTAARLSRRRYSH
jgi:hypothetical protein